MQTMKRVVLFCGLAAVLALSCQSQPTTPVGASRLIDPQVISVSADGKQAKINIGELDKVRPGQTLYVTRNNQLAGMLTVIKPGAYTSECLITASRTVSKLPADSSVALGNIRAGDRVAREFQHITRAGVARDRIPDKVPVPVESDNASLPGGVILIPRDQYDQWQKDHPPK